MNEKLKGGTIRNIGTEQINGNIIISINEDNSNIIITQDSYLRNNQPENNSADVTVKSLAESGTNIFYDFGRQICENKPTLDYESIKKIRIECKDMMKKSEDKRKLMDEFDSEYDEISDTIELITETLTLCETYKSQEVLDSRIVTEICVSFYKAQKNFQELFSVKGWEL